MAKEQINVLTSLRGIAAWWVVVFHFREHVWIEGSVAFDIAGLGYIAVDLFFIISGFVIQMTYGDWFQRSLSWQGLRDFIMLRIARIYPLHLCISLLYLINPTMIWFFSSSGHIGERYDPAYYLASLFLVHSWGFFSYLGWNVPSWSISVEFAAYLVFPLLSISLMKHLNGLLAQLLALLVLAASLALAFWGAGHQSLGVAIPEMGIVRCMLEFSMGIVAFKIRQALFELSHHTAVVATVCIALLGSGWLFLGYGLADYLVMPLFFVALMLLLTDGRNVVRRMLEVHWLVWIGEISYSTYLVHFFVKDWVKFTLVENDVRSWFAFSVYLSFVLLFSILLYHRIEVPGRRFVRKRLRAERGQGSGDSI